MAVPPVPIKKQKRLNKTKIHPKPHTLETSSSEPAGGSRHVSWILVSVPVFVFFLLLLISLPIIESANPSSVPYTLHSELNADYSVDNQQKYLPAVNLGMIVDYLRDLGTPNPQPHYAIIQDGLNTPVPTVTPNQYFTGTPPSQVDTPTATSLILTPVMSNTPQFDNGTPTFTKSPLSTLTSQPTATPTTSGRTPTPGIVKTKTPTVIKPPSTKPPATPTNPTQPPKTKHPPTWTPPAPTVTAVSPSPTKPAPTATQLPPSPTFPPATATKPPPTATQPPVATATKRPPTSTPETPYP